MMRGKPLVLMADMVHRAAPLEKKYPGRMGMLFGPPYFRDPRGMPYALDNGRFAVWSKGASWSEKEFFVHLDKTAGYPPPRWVVVPDVVADMKQTFQWWERWVPKLERRGWPLALAVQDGMEPRHVRRLDRQPDVIFVGGSTDWKWRTLERWCEEFTRVHCGRVNGENYLWTAHRAGVESSDGTSWFRDPSRIKRLNGLERYLRRSSAGLGHGGVKGFFF